MVVFEFVMHYQYIKEVYGQMKVGISGIPLRQKFRLPFPMKATVNLHIQGNCLRRGFTAAGKNC